MTEEQKKDHHDLMAKLAKTILKSKLPKSAVVGILEMLKVDIILNGGCVVIDGKPLNIADEKSDNGNREKTN